MAEEVQENEEKKGSKKGLLIAIILSVVTLIGGFAGSFFLLNTEPTKKHASYDGTKEKHDPHSHDTHDRGHAQKTTIDKRHETSAYFQFEPLTISLGPKAKSKHLRINIVLEIAESDYGTFDKAELRLRDVLINYLRAVRENDLEDPASMAKIRSQILRRLNLVMGDTHIRTLLITEYLMN